MSLFRRKPRSTRYVAHEHVGMEFLGVPTGGVRDTRPQEPSKLTEDFQEQIRYVTTYSRAKRWAKYANRLDTDS